jgi:hypothetical protein
MSQQQPDQSNADTEQDQQRVVVVTQDGMGVASKDGEDGEGAPGPADLVEQPAKVMRIGSMIKQLLEEVRGAPLDEAGRTRLADVHHRSLEELKDGLAPELVEELERIALPFGESAPSDAELRVAQAQLVGWLEGLFHGIQTALFAQQMAAQAQLAEMRRALPAGPAGHHPMAGPAHGMAPGQQGHQAQAGQPEQPGSGGTGQYL